MDFNSRVENSPFKLKQGHEVLHLELSSPDHAYILVVFKDSDTVVILHPDSENWEVSEIVLPGLAELRSTSCLFVVSPAQNYGYLAFISKDQT